MSDVNTQITTEELKKMLSESILSNELKTAYGEVLEQMTDEEKSQLAQIIIKGKTAKDDYEKSRIEELGKLNAALEKHLKNSLREEQAYIRQQFETFEGENEKAELEAVEQQINTL